MSLCNKSFLPTQVSSKVNKEHRLGPIIKEKKCGLTQIGIKPISTNTNIAVWNLNIK